MKTVRVCIEVDEKWPHYSARVCEPKGGQMLGDDFALVDIPQDAFGRFACAEIEYQAALAALLDSAGWRYEKGED